MPRTVCVWADPAELAERAARRIADAAAAAVDERGRFTVCLSGGDTPGGTYARLAAGYRDSIPWERVHVFWGDERCIPLERPDNHFTLANELLLSRVPLPAANVHRARGEADPAEAAGEYETALHEFFDDAPPRFDLVILGMGEDGHVASLFPGSEGFAERERWVVDHEVTKRGERVRRLTMTLPVLTAAREIMFLVCGELKAEMVATILEGESDLPAARVDAAATTAIWMLDRDAARAMGKLPDSAGCLG
jgi:6-phosphogluconolactonase